MLDHDSFGYGGRMRWGGVALAVTLSLGPAACGKPSEEDCKDSVISDYTGECPGADTDATGATDAGGVGAANSGGGTSGAGKGGRNGSGSGATGGEEMETVIVYEWGDVDDEGDFDSGEWVVDDASGVWHGENALHPPKLKAHDDATISFDCAGLPHTQLSFVVHRAAENTELELLADGLSRGLIKVGYEWAAQVINVAPGKHEYTLVARNLGTTDIAAPFVVDGLSCKSAAPVPGHNQVVGFDSAFVPVELDGWFVDNMRGTHQGEAAVHPPVIAPGDEPQMTFDCAGVEHTQLTFAVRRASENTELELFDGTESRGLIKVGYEWAGQVINVAPGRHEYTFVARNLGTTQIVEPYVLDTFACNLEEPAFGHNGLVTADEKFVPPEMTGEWFVDNMRGVHQGEAAVHPPVLEGHEEKELLFDCGELASGLSFAVRRASENTELEIFDGDESRGLITIGYEWGSKTYVMKTGKYRFVARNLGVPQIVEPYVLDTFACK